MSSSERNIISVFPSHMEKTPWRSVGMTPMDDDDLLSECLEELHGVLKEKRYYDLIEGIASVAREDVDEDERYGGLLVAYYRPDLTPIISQAIADTLGMDSYNMIYQENPNRHYVRTAEEIRSMPSWQPYQDL